MLIARSSNTSTVFLNIPEGNISKDMYGSLGLCSQPLHLDIYLKTRKMTQKKKILKWEIKHVHDELSLS